MRTLLFLLALLPGLLPAQENIPATGGYMAVPSSWVLGVGIGQPYGGIGVQLQLRPWEPLALFAGGGYALAGLGYNAGLNLRVLPKAQVCPVITGMYGYNAAIVVKDLPDENNLYFGTSFVLGLEIHSRRRPQRFWSVQAIFPQRPPAYEEDLKALERRPDVVIERRPWDVTVALGYHFGR